MPDIGEVLDERYQLEAGAARTSTGVVYPARRRGDGKLLSFVVASRLTDPKQRVRFVHDATVSQRLDGEHVLRVFDVGLLPNGMPFAVREPTISSLATEIRTRGPLPLAQAVAWTLEACEAIAEAHALDMAHGDLRPDNVYLARSERGEPVVKVEWMSAGKTSQATAEDPAKDLVALGVLLRVLATGQVDSEEAEGAPTLPCEVACTVARALATGNEPPFRDVAEFAEALAPFAPSGHPSARNVAFLFARAGLLKVEAPQRPPQAPLPQRGPSNAPRGESLEDSWFEHKERASQVPLMAVPSRTTTFAAVSLATVGTVLGSTVLLWATDHLPHWTGTAPRHEPAPVTLTSGETVHETSEVTLTAPPTATLHAPQQEEDDSPAAEAERARSVTKILPLPSVSDDEAELPSLHSITTTSKPAPEPPKPSPAPPTATMSAAEAPPPLPVATTTSTTASESAPAESEAADAAP
ncbi:serine/threonine protein kinase [Labilithrix luteola]|uniref:Serine/threonine protein kinase n=1 Tax=Labilithrix luteola TaxID=1391654 RepID=A0A0K1Q5C9_9BACT|nr:serine/threonine protein kinase [Labilithrix luteola]